MKRRKMLAILVLGLVLLTCLVQVSEAVEMGKAFTYQGRLIDSNSAADGLYDFQFKLFDDSNDPCSGNQLGGDVDKPDVDVIDGYFTVELDFGSNVFDGNAVWLDIGVRPGDQNDPNVYTSLSPRQEVMPTPYALQTRGIFVDNSGDVGIGTTDPRSGLHVYGSGHSGDIRLQNPLGGNSNRWVIDSKSDGSLYIEERDVGTDVRLAITTSGDVGIGTTDPRNGVHVYGTTQSGDIC
jgi:hypothetical protein